MSAEHKQRDFYYLVKVLQSCKLLEQLNIAEKMYENYKKMYMTDEYDDLWNEEVSKVIWSFEW